MLAKGNFAYVKLDMHQAEIWFAYFHTLGFVYLDYAS